MERRSERISARASDTVKWRGYRAPMSSHTTPDRSKAKIDQRRAREAAELGARLIRSGNSGAGVEALRRAIRLNPTDARVLYGFALACLELGQTEEGAAALARARLLPEEPTPGGEIN